MVIARVLSDTDGTPNWSVGDPNQAIVTVTSEAAEIPTISIAADTGNDSVEEGDDSSDSGELTFTVTRTGATEKDVTVKYTLTDSSPVSAVSGTDYESAVVDVNIPASLDATANGTITVALIGDELDEADETFVVMLANTSVNATVHATDHTETATIKDDDPLPVVSIAADESSEGNAGGSTILLISLSR